MTIHSELSGLHSISSTLPRPFLFHLTYNNEDLWVTLLHSGVDTFRCVCQRHDFKPSMTISGFVLWCSQFVKSSNFQRWCLDGIGNPFLFSVSFVLTRASTWLRPTEQELLRKGRKGERESFDPPSMRLFEWEPMGTIRCEATLGIPSHGQSLIFLFMYLSDFCLVYLSVYLSILYFLFLIKVAINSGFPPVFWKTQMIAGCRANTSSAELEFLDFGRKPMPESFAIPTMPWRCEAGSVIFRMGLDGRMHSG